VTNVSIRAERPEDAAAIHAVHGAAFPADAEANLVDALRASSRLSLSLVAECNGGVVGHVAFSPITVEGVLSGWGLAPMSVTPEFQRQGVGGRLIDDGLARARDAGIPFVVVLGHPEYYPRFGFARARDFGLANVYGADESFMVVELRSGGIPKGGGLVKYCEAFDPWG